MNGHELCRKCISKFAGRQIYIPKNKRIVLMDVRKMRDKGQSISTIANAFNRTERHIYRLLRRNEASNA